MYVGQMVHGCLISATRNPQVSTRTRFFLHAVNKNAAENPHGNLKGDKSDIKKQRQTRQDFEGSQLPYSAHITWYISRPCIREQENRFQFDFLHNFPPLDFAVSSGF